MGPQMQEFNPSAWIKQVFEDFHRTLPPSQQMLFVPMAERTLNTLESWRKGFEANLAQQQGNKHVGE